jgi:hypothetical protein
MSTRAEWFRYYAERAHPVRRSVAEASAPVAGAAKRTGDQGVAKRATYAREEHAARPSRKSTRKSAHRQKTDVQFRMKRRAAEVQPRVP